MAAVAIAGCDVVVTIAKVIKNAVDIQTAANAIATPLGIESLLACCTPFRRKRLDQYSVSALPRIANTVKVTNYRPTKRGNRQSQVSFRSEPHRKESRLARRAQ